MLQPHVIMAQVQTCDDDLAQVVERRTPLGEGCSLIRLHTTNRMLPFLKHPHVAYINPIPLSFFLLNMNNYPHVTSSSPASDASSRLPPVVHTL